MGHAHLLLIKVYIPSSGYWLCARLLLVESAQQLVPILSLALSTVRPNTDETINYQPCAHLLLVEGAQQRGLVGREAVPLAAHHAVSHQLHHTLVQPRGQAVRAQSWLQGVGQRLAIQREGACEGRGVGCGRQGVEGGVWEAGELGS